MKTALKMPLLAALVFSMSACQTLNKKEAVNAEYIPREVLFGNPDITGIKISPDGKYVTYLSAHKGVLNIWAQEFGKPQTAKPVTHDTKRGIFRYNWTYTPGILTFSQDVAGDENFGLYTLNVATGEITEITKPGKITSQIAETSHLRPQEVVIMTNERDPKYFDYKILNLKTKATTDLFTNTENYAGIMFDKNFHPIIASQSNKDGSSTIFLWNSGSKKFVKKTVVPFEDSMTSSAVDVSHDGSKVYLLDSRKRDKAALIEWDIKSDKSKVVASDERSDIQGLQMHPQTGKLLWASSYYLKRDIQFFDKDFQKHFESIEKKLNTEINVTSMSLDGNQWVLFADSTDKPVAFYFYDVKTETLSQPLYHTKSMIPYADRMSPMQAIEIPSRDGYQLVSYLTQARKPAGKSLVLLVHGGPWGRDDYGYNPYHQWLADRGYNVLSVNFRASTGFGKKFLNAGDKQWGRKMHDDLIDAVTWAVKNDYADPKQVVIMGGSYGGYAALAGVTFTPDTFAAAVDIVGPSNLETLLATVPPYWESFRANLYKRVGDPTTAAGKKLLKERSPLTHVDKIKKPLLILQGANDPRVKKAEADQIYNAMVAKKIPVEYVLFPDEGHGFAKAANNMGANAITEEFLQKYLKGRLEPIEAQVKASSAQFITTPQ